MSGLPRRLSARNPAPSSVTVAVKSPAVISNCAPVSGSAGSDMRTILALAAQTVPAGLLGERGTFSPAGSLHPSGLSCPSARSSASPARLLRRWPPVARCYLKRPDIAGESYHIARVMLCALIKFTATRDQPHRRPAGVAEHLG